MSESSRNRSKRHVREVQIPSTEAQNRFGRVLDLVAKNSTVYITKHGEPQAVVLSIEQHRALTSGTRPDLGLLTQQFDRLAEEIRSPKTQAAVTKAFKATPRELGEAAVSGAARDDEP